ncbi:hypothetical protein DF018_18620 [Burkholderia cenocepacia]|nr:hypothetical protein DF132_13315 [Burkholderia cenocepacia]RQV68059.1 hypothetical protein DF018_18620 [Burkholderia cenocepacia]
MTDHRYVFQRPIEAARLQARRRYAVRTAHAPGERAAATSASPSRRGPAAAAAARCAMPAQRPSSARHKREPSHDTVQPFAFARRGCRGPSVPT